MATVNVGAMAARLGLDPSEFLDKMKGVQGFNGLMSGEMARAWKQTSREGTESFRLIDEALGIRVSRPLTRILTHEFPAFARGLQTILGGAVFGALATVGVEAFDKLEKKIERAQKAQEEFREATAKIGTTLENISDSWAGKIAALSNQNPITALGKQGAEEARRQFDELFKITEEAEKKRSAASGISTQALATAGDWWHSIWSSEATLLSEQAQTELQKIRHGIDEAFRADHLAGGHSAAKVIQNDLDQVNAKLEDMKPLAAAADAALELAMSANVAEADTTGAARSKAEAIEAQTAALSRQKEMLEQVKKEIEGQREAWEKAKAAADAHTEAVKAQAAVVSLHKEMASSLAKLQPETDPIAKLDMEIAAMRSTAVASLSAMVPDAQKGIISAFGFDRVSASVSAYEKELDRLKIKLEGDILARQAPDLLNKPLPGGEPKTTALPFDLAAQPVMPTLGAGGRPAAKFDTFAKDTVAQYAMASQAIDDAMSPQQKYKLVEDELDLLLKKKLIDQNAYNASLAQAIDLRSRSAKQGLGGAVDELNPGGGKMQELQQRMDTLRGMQSTGVGLDGTKLNAGDLAAVQLAMEGITEEQNKILLKTGDIDAGIKAWADDLQRVQSAGELAFEALSQSSKGFEDGAIQSFMLVMNSQRGEQRKLIHDLEAMWSKYFAGLAQMGMKKGLDQLLAPVGKAISGGLGGGANAGRAATGVTGAASLTSAGTILHTAATALLTAATALRASAGGVGGGAGGGGIPFLGGGAGDAVDAGAAIPFFAEGGDATPGSSFISGEAGAEQVDLDRSGGAHITPLGGGGDTHIHNDFSHTVMTDDLMRRAEALHMMKTSEARMMQAMPAMQREIGLRKRT